MTILSSELENDPLGIGYAGMSDHQCANSLNAVTRSGITPIPSTELLAWSGGGAVDGSVKSRYERIEEGAISGVESVRGACKAAVQLVSRDGTTLDLSLPSRVALVDILVSGNVLTSVEKSELEALGSTSISRAQELGLGRVRVGDVQRAR